MQLRKNQSKLSMFLVSNHVCALYKMIQKHGFHSDVLARINPQVRRYQSRGPNVAHNCY